MFEFALEGYTKKQSMGTFSLLYFVTFFSFLFHTLNQYSYILCLIYQCECINASVITMYISIDMYNIVNDTLTHSY